MNFHFGLTTLSAESLDDDAFRRVPELGPAPDMVDDDLPSNLEYLDASYGTAAGFREILDEDADDDFGLHIGTATATFVNPPGGIGVISNAGGETVKMLTTSIPIIENFYDNILPDSITGIPE